MTPHYDTVGNETWTTSVRPINFVARRKDATIKTLHFEGGPNCKIHHYEFDIYLNSPGYLTPAHLQHIHP
jgi:hypothetical protein